MNALAHPTHHATQQLDRYTHFHTTMQQSPHWLKWVATNSPRKLPLPLRRSPPKSNTPIPSPTPLTTPNGTRIQSAVSPQYTCADRQTWDDRSITLVLCSAILIASDALKTNARCHMYTLLETLPVLWNFSEQRPHCFLSQNLWPQFHPPAHRCQSP